MRLDKWLWAARFFKTRSLAANAASGGKIDINGDRAKPAKTIKTGDRLTVRNGPYVWDVTVVALSERRGPASEAQALYRESDRSRVSRAEKAAQIKAERQAFPAQPKGRPTKRERRTLIKFTRENS